MLATKTVIKVAFTNADLNTPGERRMSTQFYIEPDTNASSKYDAFFTNVIPKIEALTDAALIQLDLNTEFRPTVPVYFTTINAEADVNERAMISGETLNADRVVRVKIPCINPAVADSKDVIMTPQGGAKNLAMKTLIKVIAGLGPDFKVVTTADRMSTTTGKGIVSFGGSILVNLSESKGVAVRSKDKSHSR